MRKKARVVLWLLPLLVAGVIASASAGAAKNTASLAPVAHQQSALAATPTPGRIGDLPPGTPNTSPPGGPAITPHLDPTTNGGAAFTVADVQQYVLAHGCPCGALVPGAHLTIVKILFVTSQEASALLNGEYVERPDNYIVCYVLMHGPFYPAFSVPYGAKLPPTIDSGYEIFDAQTGNMLQYGGG